MRQIRCDGCGKTLDDPRGYSARNPEIDGWHEAYVYVECSDDTWSFDACSWACVADIAMRRAANELGERPGGTE